MNKLLHSIKRRLSSLNVKRRQLQWLATHRSATNTVPIFIVGSQRSGTGMLSKCFGGSPEFEDLGEIDPRAFDRYTLRDDDTIRGLIEECRFPFIVFKPLKDSHRVAQLLALHPSARVIWAYRHFDDRINSAVKKFGRHPLEVFDLFKAGSFDRWQLQGMSDEVRMALKAHLDERNLSEIDGAALMWWVRNSLYYSQELEREHRAMLWSYDAFVLDPQNGVRELLSFVGGSWNTGMLAGIHDKSIRKDQAPLMDSAIREMCQQLFDRLETSRQGGANRDIR